MTIILVSRDMNHVEQAIKALFPFDPPMNIRIYVANL